MEPVASRLLALIEYFGLTASAFADKTGVQRSGISHLLSGRNKPSLDLVIKILDAFPDVDLYWLLTGKGTIIKSINSDVEIRQPVISVKESKLVETETITASPPEISSDKVIVFHSDNTFSEYVRRK